MNHDPQDPEPAHRPRGRRVIPGGAGGDRQDRRSVLRQGRQGRRGRQRAQRQARQNRGSAQRGFQGASEGGARDGQGPSRSRARDSPELADLFAKVLIGGLKHLIRRGVDRGYVPVEEELPVLRGRVNFQGSMQLMLRRSPRLCCEFDELQYDILTNQILRATASRLTRVTGIDRELAHELRMLSKVFDDVSEPRLSKHVFRQVQIHRHNAFYHFLIRVCELIYEATLAQTLKQRELLILPVRL